MKTVKYVSLLTLMYLGFGVVTVSAQQNLAQQAYLIFERNCLNCHGPSGSFREQIVIDSAENLVNTGQVVPRNPDASELYTRLLHKNPAKRMPLGQPALSDAAIATIRNWIQAGAPNWDVRPDDVNFITTDAMLTTIHGHLKTLDEFNRPYARYFTMTHLYNAGESPETLHAYRVALSKLVNSLSWGFAVINPHPIDAAKMIFYIDLRDYEWDTRAAWSQIEATYPYTIEFNAEHHGTLLLKLTYLQGEANSEVPLVHVDWFLANASLPPLYHDILGLPGTEQELERELGIDVARNLQSSPGVRVWRAGTNNSGVSQHNRVVERHTSRYGAYWKSHDFDGSAGAKHIFTHPLSFARAGGEVIFNLPNGLQAYYISDGLGNRIDVAPTEIVSNPAASDPAVRNGISCIGCHTEGMKTFEDEVRATILQTTNPAYDKAHALRLYVEQAKMDDLVAEDTERYGAALVKTGGAFDEIEPVSRFYEAFQGALNASQAAAAIGMAQAVFLAKIRSDPSLQNLGLTGLLSGGSVKRDVWESNFSDLVSCVYGDDCVAPVIVPPTLTPVFGHPIPDVNLRAVIAETLGKAPAALTTADLARLPHLYAHDRNISDLTGLAHATHLKTIELCCNTISDISPLAGLTRLKSLELHSNRITDVSPLARLTNLEYFDLRDNNISDFSPVKALSNKIYIRVRGNPGSLPQGGPKITGPWLWLLMPRTDFETFRRRDLLARASGGDVTEQEIATNGAREGATLGDSTWTSQEIAATGWNNINELVRGLGTAKSDGENVIYGSIVLNSPREQQTKLYAGSDDTHKIWLNGLLINEKYNSSSDGYEQSFPVRLKKGKNVLLVAVHDWGGGWCGFFGFASDTEYTVLSPDGGFSLSTEPAQIAVGDTFTLSLNATIITDLAGWETDIAFDPAILKVNSVSEGDFLKKGGGRTFFQKGTIQNKRGKVTGIQSVTFSEGGIKGEGTLLSVQFMALTRGETRVVLRDFRAGTSTGKPIASRPIEMFIVVGGPPAAPAFVPETTTLHHNYPNPFNPETWIPYQLAEAADVTLHIYAVNGVLVRTLTLGHQPAGVYRSQSRSAYWDGKNALGERAASGIYFYTLTAGDFTATRKMLIRK